MRWQETRVSTPRNPPPLPSKTTESTKGCNRTHANTLPTYVCVWEEARPSRPFQDGFNTRLVFELQEKSDVLQYVAAISCSCRSTFNAAPQRRPAHTHTGVCVWSFSSNIWARCQMFRSGIRFCTWMAARQACVSYCAHTHTQIEGAHNKGL